MYDHNSSNKKDRRDFLKNSLLLGGAFIFGCTKKSQTASQAPLSQNSPIFTAKSKVVVAGSDTVRASDNTLDSSGVLRLLDTGVQNFYKSNSPKAAWRKFVAPDDVVGLKVNCLGGRGISTSKELVESIIYRLEEAGIKRNQIIIWDRMNDDLERVDYKINYGGSDVQCYGNDVAGYTDDFLFSGQVGSLVSKTLTEKCSVVINLPVLKDHGIVGVTIGMKNLYGVIHNPNKYHGNCGNPYVADLNALPVIRSKVRLTICDALTAQYEGGPPFKPQWTWHYNGLLIGTDPVALDYTGWQIIEKKRKEAGIRSLKEAGREPTYIATAADADHRLGTNDPGKIEITNC
jgi:uncharacterized protein (DUF362 family)